MAGNIIGEPINATILEQIDNRQSVSGAGYNSSSITRSPQVLNFLNNRSAWIKMASGVFLEDDALYQLEEISKQEGGYISEDEIQNLKGTSLAKNTVLFNTIQSFDAQGEKKYTSRSGVRNNNLLQDSLGKMYGGLGGNSQGLQPVGGITDIKIENINRGSISKATVNIKVYNRFQFNLIDLAYLKLGYIMMLEWGWDKYIDSIDPETGAVIKDMPYTIIEKEWFDGKNYTQKNILNLINQKQLQHKGNYDGFFGKVSNYTWKANPDGSFDIKIDLITLGSVIESMKVNLSPEVPIDEATLKINQEKLAELLDVEEGENEGEYDSPLINNMGGDKLSIFLSSTVINFPENNLDHVFLPNLVTELVPISYGTIAAITTIPVVGTTVGGIAALTKYLTSYTGNIPEEDRYYIRLGVFLDKLKGLTIPYVKNGDTMKAPSLEVDTGVSNNVCNYITNLIPLDPSICIFSIQLSSEYDSITLLDVPKYNSNMRPFAVNNDGVVYGQIMNINMNINFLQKVIVDNIDKDGNLTLFSLLETICDGINQSTGGATMLEPAIKNDNVVYILEQNSIKGFGFEKTDTAPIDIQGYSEGGQSNFVRDFSFNTKITPDMMSMISIGATSEGIDSRQINASPWKKWYRGVKNRFEESYVVQDKNVAAPSLAEKWQTPEKIIVERFKADLLAGNIDYDHIVMAGYDWEWNNHDLADINPDGLMNSGFFTSNKTAADNLITGTADNPIYSPLAQEVINRVHEVEDEDNAFAIANSLTVVANEDDIPKGEEYKQYFVNAFGGKTGTADKRTFWPGYRELSVDRDDSLWWYGKDNNDFINRGKTSFNTYIADLSNEESKKNPDNAASTNGFIPVELGLTVDGLSGVKIYQKLEITQRFLPVSYSKALRFVIRGVNHTVSGNQWVTDLETISTSISDQKSSVKAAKSYGVKADASVSAKTPTKVLGPIPPKNPNEKLKIYDNRTVAGVPFDKRTYKTYQGIDWLVGEMNNNTQNQWRGFLNALNERYPGYELKINATYRSYQRSIQLKQINSSNATAGKSPHNYALGVDMNVKDPNGKVYLKKDYSSWKASGIPQIAVSEFKMRWGGDFSGYLDCVHFDVSRATPKIQANAKKENPGLPQSQWDTQNTKLT